MVGLGRFELPTSRLSSARSNQLSYKPVAGISNQRSGIRTILAYLIPDLYLLMPEQLVREEREMKTAASRQQGSDVSNQRSDDHCDRHCPVMFLSAG
jgi:hypothetical protein